MSKKNYHDQTVEEKLIHLYKLQTIDAKIDELRRSRGDLPLKIKDLEDEITGLRTRLTNLQDENKTLESQIKENEVLIKDAEKKIKKYETQLDNVRNNREFESLKKQIEYESLEIKLAEKRIKDYLKKLDENLKLIKETKDLLKEKDTELDEIKKELVEIMKETEEKEQKLLKVRAEVEKLIEPRLLSGYTRIRNAMRNGLAVVSIFKNACGGCFNKIPPQRQLEVGMHRKIISCEFCGRILVDDTIVETVNEDLKKVLK